MRVLFASLSSVGHTYPLIPLAIATREAGHTVRFAAGENVHEPLAANGLRPFRPADAFYEIYEEDLTPELTRWRPDLIIHEWALPGAAAAAKKAEIPNIWHSFGRMYPKNIGLEQPTGTGRPHIDICPPSLQDKNFLETEERIELRPVPFSPPGAIPAEQGPLIYLTLGTAFGTAELLTTAITALATLGMRVVVATGRVSPEDLGVLPHGVTAHSWLPQAKLLPHATLVVHHGGSGTTLAALTTGTPQLILPQGADQFANAEALTTAGAALTLNQEEQTTEAITEQAKTLLSQNNHREAAKTIAKEIAQMPSPEQVAKTLQNHKTP
jgi:UDP:flavonoid glycosyltransferase YjiC (YdhE family)